MAQELLLLNPEKTLISYRLAGLGSRTLAHILDAILCIGLLITLAFGLSALPIPGLPEVVLPPLMSLGPFAYFILLEGLWNGQTPGKKAAGIRVRMSDGTPVTFTAALGRNLLRPADFLPIGYFVGMLAMFTNTRSQRLGDLVANTVVIYEKRGHPYFTPAPYVLGIHPFEPHVGELRGMTVEEYVALKKLCDRFPELSRSVQERLIREVWQPIAVKLDVKPVQNVHPVYLAEATVMKYGRSHGLL